MALGQKKGFYFHLYLLPIGGVSRFEIFFAKTETRRGLTREAERQQFILLCDN